MAHIWWVLSTTFAALAVEVTIVFLLALLPSVSPAFRAFSTAGGIGDRRGNCPQQKFASGVRAPGHAPASARWAIFGLIEMKSQGLAELARYILVTGHHRGWAVWDSYSHALGRRRWWHREPSALGHDDALATVTLSDD